MSKLFTYAGMMSGTILLFYMAGLVDTVTPSSMLLTLILDPQNLTTGSFYSLFMIGSIAAVGLTGIVVGIISRDFRFSAKTIMLTPLITIGTDFFVTVYNVIAIFNKWIALIIISPIFFMYIIVVAEWWTS